MIYELLHNKIIVSTFLAFITSGMMKVLLRYIAYDELDWLVFFRTGGMPSSHTAVVSALTTAIYLSEGMTNLFISSLVFSLIIVSDAVGIRRAAGKQAQVINKMIDEFKYYRKLKTKRLYELLGHTPKQVIVGFLLGFLIAKLVFLL